MTKDCVYCDHYPHYVFVDDDRGQLDICECCVGQVDDPAECDGKAG